MGLQACALLWTSLPIAVVMLCDVEMTETETGAPGSRYQMLLQVSPPVRPLLGSLLRSLLQP